MTHEDIYDQLAPLYQLSDITTPAEAGRVASQKVPLGQKTAAYHAAYHAFRNSSQEYRAYQREMYRTSTAYRERKKAQARVAMQRFRAKKRKAQS